jgi:hypothetical protein
LTAERESGGNSEFEENCESSDEDDNESNSSGTSDDGDSNFDATSEFSEGFYIKHPSIQLIKKEKTMRIAMKRNWKG